MHLPFFVFSGSVFFGGVFVALVFFLPSLSAADSPWIPRVEERFRNPYGFSARFLQKTTSPALGEEITATGELFYSPGRILWIYREPDPATYYLTRDEFLWVQPEEKQVVRISLEKAFLSEAPVFLLRGLKDLGDLFSLERVEMVRKGSVRLYLLPKKPIPQVEELILLYEHGEGWVREIRSRDPAGGANTFQFSELRSGTPGHPVAPEFTFPPGYRIFTPP